jgi:PBP1b-binding outer membrane lipoprotein LpoB
MKKITSILVGIVLFGSCAPKYTASFQNYHRTSPQSFSSINNNNGSLSNQNTHESNLESKENPILLASLNNTPVNIIGKPALVVIDSNSITKSNNDSQLDKQASKKEFKSNKLSIKAAIKEYKSQSKTSEGEKKKDGFAIAGFISSVVGLFVLWPLCIVGVILSAIGMKSEKRGLAIAGLIIGIIGVAIVLISGAALAAA